MEPRRVLNGVPIANPDPFYLKSTSAAIVVAAGDGLLQNDFDAEGSSLTVNAVANATNGTITAWGSDGSFTFTPTGSFTGFATFTYTVSDGTATSESAKVTISFGQIFSQNLLADEHGANNVLHSGGLETSIPLSPKFDLVYRSDTVEPKPVIAVETIFNGAPSGTTLTALSAQLKRNGANDGSAVTYTSGLPSSAGTKLRFALQSANSTALDTGMYEYTVVLTATFSNSTTSNTTFKVSKAIVNRSNDSSTKRSPFGEGWWLDGLDSLAVSSAGVLWVHGNGDAYWFNYNGSSYDKASGDLSFSTLTKPTSTTFRITDKWGNTRNFDLESDNVTGTLVSTKKINNTANQFEFDYDSSNRLTTLSDEFGRDYTLSYTNGLLTAFTDFSGRASTPAYHSTDPGVLITVTHAAQPGGAASYLQYSSVVWTLTNSLGKLTQVTDPDGNYDQYVYYSGDGLFNKIIHGNNLSTWELFPMLREGLKTGTGNAAYTVTDNISTSGANAAKYIDERGYDFKFRTDSFGNVAQVLSEAGSYTKWDFSPANLLYRETAADPDGSGSTYSSPITKFGYNSSGDLLKIVHPDGKTIVYTVDGTLHLPLTIVNELSKTVQTNTYDSVGNLLTRKDALNYTWTYTYDQTDSNSANRHGRLLTITSPDPDGAGALTALVTTLEYETTHANYTLVKKVINADNTGGAPSDKDFAYDSNDNLSSVTDELGNVTAFAYDNLDRLRRTTRPAASGGGTQPLYDMVYNGKGQLLKEIDPLGNYTEYVYGNRGWITEIKRRDSGNTVIATTTYAYYETGEVFTIDLPSYSGTAVQTYVYDENGQVVSYTGPEGGETTYAYDLLGRMTQTVDPYDRTIDYEYDVRSRLIKSTDNDPDGSGFRARPITQFAYDDASQLTSVTDPLGRVTAYAFADNGWLTSMTLPDPDGFGAQSAPVYKYTYDALGRKTKVEDPQTPSYYSNGRPTLFEYDKMNRLTKVTYPDPDGSGSATAPTDNYTYNLAGWLTNDRGTVLAYDNLGRVTSKTLVDPDGAGALASPVFSYQYDLVGNVIKWTDAIGNFTNAFTEIEYDALYRQIEVTQPDPDASGSLSAPVWTYAFTGNRLTSVTDPLGHATDYGYDDAGRRTSVTSPDPDGGGSLGASVTQYAFDYLDRLTSITTDPDGSGGTSASVVAYGYDILSRLSTITDPLGKVTTNAYDNAGQLLSLTDPLGNSTFWSYDGLGRATMETNAFGYSRTFEFNAAGTLARKIDRLGRITEFGYDHMDRQTSEVWYNAASTAPYVTTATTTQGATGTNEVQTVTNSNLTSGTFRLAFDGQVTAPIAYNASASTVESALEALDAIDNVTVTGSSGSFTVTFVGAQTGKNVSQLWGDAKLSSNGSSVRSMAYTFDVKSNMTAASDASAAFTYTYDELGRVTTELVDATGSSLVPKIYLYSTYDANNNRLTFAATFSQIVDEIVVSTRDFKNTYTFDALSRMVKIQQTNQPISTYYAVTAKEVDITYNALGQISYMDRFQNTSATKPSLRTGITYDSANRMTELDYRNIDSSNKATTLNEYDFVYDRMDRITSITSTADGTSTIGYDYRSQVTSADHASPRSDESYAFDDNGNRSGGSYTTGTNNQTTADSTYTYTYDKEGNRSRRTKTSDGSYEDYTWDHRNRLTKVTFKNSGGTELKNVEYTYDLYNRLIRRKYDADGPGSGAAVNMYLIAYDGINPTLAFDGTAQLDVSNRFLWGPLVDQLLADEQVSTPTTAGNTLWPLGDQVGTIRDLVDYDEGTPAFSITNHRTYDSFGKLTAESQSTVDEIFAYTGKFFDDVTAQSNHLHRWMDVNLGKWISEDPIGFFGCDQNLQRYASNDSICSVDSTGLLQGDGIAAASASDTAKKIYDEFGLGGDEQLLIKMVVIYDNMAAGRDPDISLDDPDVKRFFVLVGTELVKIYGEQHKLGILQRIELANAIENAKGNRTKDPFAPIPGQRFGAAAGEAAVGAILGGARRTSNPKHHPNSTNPEPANVEELWKKSIPDKQGRRWSIDDNGVIHRFSKPSNGESHWNGSTGDDFPVLDEHIPIDIRRKLKSK